MRVVGVAAVGLLAELHRACFPVGERWDAAAMTELLAMPGCFAIVADDGGLALARVVADEAELLTIGVLPPARRQGVARHLLRDLVDEAAARGARSLFLEVSVTNLPALALYERGGFVEIGRRRCYYADGGDALVLACRDLSSMITGV